MSTSFEKIQIRGIYFQGSAMSIIEPSTEIISGPVGLVLLGGAPKLSRVWGTLFQTPHNYTQTPQKEFD